MNAAWTPPPCEFCIDDIIDRWAVTYAHATEGTSMERDPKTGALTENEEAIIRLRGKMAALDVEAMMDLRGRVEVLEAKIAAQVVPDLSEHVEQVAFEGLAGGAFGAQPAAATVEPEITSALAAKNLDLCAALGRILAITPELSDWDPVKAAAMMQAIAKEALGQ